MKAINYVKRIKPTDIENQLCQFVYVINNIARQIDTARGVVLNRSVVAVSRKKQFFLTPKAKPKITCRITKKIPNMTLVKSVKAQKKTHYVAGQERKAISKQRIKQFEYTGRYLAG